MSRDAGLAKERWELKQAITSGMHIMLMGLIFEYTNRLIQKVTRKRVPPPFYLTVIIVAIGVQLIQLPGWIVAVLLKETHQYSELSLLGFLYIELAFLGVLVAKMNISYVLKSLRDHIIDAIECTENLIDLHRCLSNFWSLRKQVTSSIVCGMIAGALTAVSVSQSMRHFIGIGFTISATLAWTIAVIPVYYLFQMALLPLRLSGYQYDLFEANPIRSDVLRHLSLLLKNYTYVIALFIAFATFVCGLNSSTRSLSIIMLILAWIPLTAQFLSNRSALKTIARNAKWQTLKEVELRIKTIRDGADLANKETMESMTRLWDYHDRINATYDVNLEVRARASFINQIMLTVLASVLANIDSILRFLQSLVFSVLRASRM